MTKTFASCVEQPIACLFSVNNFVLVTLDPSIADNAYAAISCKLQLPGEVKPPFINEGIMTSFNGLDILQTHDYLKINSISYIF
jgi:hypothetical protein